MAGALSPTFNMAATLSGRRARSGRLVLDGADVVGGFGPAAGLRLGDETLGATGRTPVMPPVAHEDEVRLGPERLQQGERGAGPGLRFVEHRRHPRPQFGALLGREVVA